MPAIVPHTTEDAERTKTALALVYDTPENVESIAAAHGINPETLLDVLGTDAGMRAALVRAEELRQSGELLKRKALNPLERLVDQIAEYIEAGQISPSAAPKVAETLFKLTGLTEERAARLKVQAEDDTPKATIMILHGEEPDPPPEKPNEHRIVIRLPNVKQQGNERPNRIIDVTPTEGEEGGDGL